MQSCSGGMAASWWPGVVCPITEKLEAVAFCCFHPREFVLGDDVVYTGPAALQKNGQCDTAAAKKTVAGQSGDVEGRHREVKNCKEGHAGVAVRRCKNGAHHTEAKDVSTLVAGAHQPHPSADGGVRGCKN